MRKFSTLLFVFVSFAGSFTLADELPAVSDRAPVPAAHFPDTLHAVVWRNWGLVDPARLAKVLETTPDNVRDLAVSMGLPANGNPHPEFERRGYITIIRRNWHLLPYDQLVELLGIDSAELAFRLREDDFLYWKLGLMKPHCDRVLYAPPGDAARKRAAEISAVVKEQFGDQLTQEGEHRFEFLESLSRPDGTRPAKVAPAADGLRFIYSYFAMYGDPLSDPNLDPYPDGLLQRLRDQGVNGIWLHTVLRQLAPGGKDFPEFGAGCEARLAQLRNLIDRADRFGIKIYLYMNEPRAMPKSFFSQRPEMAGAEEHDHVAMCTSDPRVRRWISDSLAHVFREAPGLGGVFAITASENLTNCASRGKRADCPRCAKRTDTEVLVEINKAIEEGVHRSSPDAKVILWDWGWNNHGDARDIIAQLPQSAWLMSVSEWSLPIDRGGVKLKVGEYSMSAVGPGPRALSHWAAARERGMNTIAKVQFNNTWELSAVPSLPVLDLVAKHCESLAKAGIENLMLSWSLGGYPSINLEVANRFDADRAASAQTVLQAVAVKYFGPDGAPHARRAWSTFSKAFQEYPFDLSVLYRGPQQFGPANLLFSKSTGYPAASLAFPHDDLNGWRGPYPPEVFTSQFAKVAEEWKPGLAELETAVQKAPAAQRKIAAAELRFAKAAQLHFASVANQARFVTIRDELKASGNNDQAGFRKELSRLLEAEIAAARELHDLTTADSRIGYEASNHYYYTPSDLIEKVINCKHLQAEFAGRGQHD